MLTLFILLTLSILISCLFSGSETGFVSLNPLKVAHAAAQGNFTARLGMRLLGKRNQLLTTVLIGNNICNIASALLFAMLFARIDARVSLDLSKIPSPESWFLTPVLVVFSEMIPKSLYRTHAFSLTMKSVPALAFFFFLLSPIFWVVDLASKIFGGSVSSPARDAEVREEILLVAVEGARRGNIFESADRIMKNTLGMKGRRVGEFSVGIGEWRGHSAAYTSTQMLSEFGAALGARSDEVVVFDEGGDRPIGYVSLMEAAAHRGGGGLATFGSLARPLPRLRSGMEALSCLRRMPPDSPRYHLVFEGDEAVGILDKMALFGAAFAKS